MHASCPYKCVHFQTQHSRGGRGWVGAPGGGQAQNVGLLTACLAQPSNPLFVHEGACVRLRACCQHRPRCVGGAASLTNQRQREPVQWEALGEEGEDVFTTTDIEALTGLCVVFTFFTANDDGFGHGPMCPVRTDLCLSATMPLFLSHTLNPSLLRSLEYNAEACRCECLKFPRSRAVFTAIDQHCL
ncbi:hypothetical protein JZ751_011143 [Albula glossodonta]|uniref:Uncharacterized protein n=1 Tax=Albula glossodonta TaxID=121402 RepID=A0A8T2NU33_9TELE|nr:hypothetical protein JZ751_011143 [Albula glossodonta]